MLYSFFTNRPFSQDLTRASSRCYALVVRKLEEQKETLYKVENELKKEILNYEHDIQRLSDGDAESRKQLVIAQAKIDKLNSRLKELQDSAREQGQKIAQFLTQKERLQAEIVDNERQIASKQSDNAQLLPENMLFQKQIATLNQDYDVQQDKNAQLCSELLKLKYESQTISASYTSLNVRLQNTEKFIFQLKQKLSQTIQLSSKVQQQKRALQNKYIDYQEKLAIEVDRLQEQQFKANEEIIRLDTMNKILQIEIGQYKQRESAVFSIVKESSLINERKDNISPIRQKPKKEKKVMQIPMLDSDYNMKPLQAASRRTSMNASRAIEKDSLKQSQLLKSSLFGDITPMQKFSLFIKKSRCGTTKLEDDAVQISYCDRNEKRDSVKGQNPLTKSKNPIYFENLVFKQI